MNAFHVDVTVVTPARASNTLVLGTPPVAPGSRRDDFIAADELVSNWKLSFKTDLGLPVKVGITVSAISCSSLLISPASGGYFSRVILPAVMSLELLTVDLYCVDSVNATLRAMITLTLIPNHSSTSQGSTLHLFVLVHCVCMCECVISCTQCPILSFDSSGAK